MIDCNDCKHITITEEQQFAGKNAKIPHECIVYDERLFHYSSMKDHNRKIFPCQQCQKDKNKNFEAASNE